MQGWKEDELECCAKQACRSFRLAVDDGDDISNGATFKNDLATPGKSTVFVLEAPNSVWWGFLSSDSGSIVVVDDQPTWREEASGGCCFRVYLSQQRARRR